MKKNMICATNYLRKQANTVVFVFLFQHLMRRVPNVATFSAVNYAYENPVPIYYADTPPPYPGTTNTTAYPGTTTLYPGSEGATISGTVSSIPSVTCGTTVPTQGSNGMAGFHSMNKTN